MSVFLSIMMGICLLSACGGSDPIPEGRPDFRTCEKFLSLDEIKLFLGKPHLVFRAGEVTNSARTLNETIAAACTAGFELNDHTSAIGLAAIKFDSESAATDHLERIMTETKSRKSTGDQMAFDTFAKDSYEVAPGELGIAGIVGFRDGPHIVQLHLTSAAGHPYLTEIEALITLAQVIKDRLNPVVPEPQTDYS